LIKIWYGSLRRRVFPFQILFFYWTTNESNMGHGYDGKGTGKSGAFTIAGGFLIDGMSSLI